MKEEQHVVIRFLYSEDMKAATIHESLSAVQHFDSLEHVQMD
jgi:hypothetical protein